MKLDQGPSGLLEAVGMTSLARLQLVDCRITGGTLRSVGPFASIQLRQSELVDMQIEGVEIESQFTATVQGDIVNEGDLRIGGSGSQTATLKPASADAMLTGGKGRVLMTHAVGSRLGDEDHLGLLTNAAGHLIEGQGRIVGPIVNDGTILANAAPGAITVESDIIGTGNLHAEGGTLRLGTGTQPVFVSGATLRVVDVAGQPGMVESVGNATISISGTVTVDEGGEYRGAAGSAATLTAANLDVLATNDLGGSLTLSDNMAMVIPGNVRVLACALSLRGCIPPSMNSTGMSSTQVGGHLDLQGDVSVSVESGLPYRLAGNFLNHATSPESFNWANGLLTMDGAVAQTFEAAGNDYGPHNPLGFFQNFAVGTIHIEPGREVDIVNDFDNIIGGTPCEVLYVDTLSLGQGSTLRLNGCNVYFNTLERETGAMVELIGGAILIGTHAGDLDLDGYVTLMDLDQFVAVLLDGTCSDPCLARGDVNTDGQIDGVDIGLFIRLLTGW